MHSSNRIHEAFDSVKAGEELKSLTKEYLRTARQREGRQRRRADTGKPVFRRAFAGLCVMLALVLGGGGYFFMGIPVSYVSIDVNPSIELALNRLDRVISAEAYNEDGIIILNTISVGGMYYTEAVEQLVKSEAMQPYLSENAGLTFTVASGSAQKENALLGGIESTSGCREHGGLGYGADIGTVQEAHDNGLSLGKYAAYQVLSQYDGSITADDCHDMTMSEIHGLIEAHEHGGYDGNGRHNEGYGTDDGDVGNESGDTNGGGVGTGSNGANGGYESHGNGGHRAGHGYSHE